ncbi:GNAT family N-acetyltransferase [Chryseobacterium sp. CFS15]|uniref:GNAT family N-acetyltransferase n=1 Tax=Chryseobacterium sp. CFS15 TaxID=2986946 RepID=UPI0028099F39|nr:GNAT family N-acetyltransferase [Chryseobacterium sp. CFS15]MDQ8141077.1 GNAT family N-acetyltransferase [Chryseobacterium sp. CFS15]
MYNIILSAPSDYPRIMEIWESAVVATHDFLTTEDFNYFKEVIPKDYLPNLNVYLIAEEREIVGFAAVAEDTLEMLFIHTDFRGKGYGKILCKFMKDKIGFTKVDVNEQNQLALQFYENMGFRKISRSAKDNSGKNYPIIHMGL